MRYLFSNITLFMVGFIACGFIVIGFFLQAILIPIQDFHLLSDEALLLAQREYALNYSLGKRLFVVGIVLMVFVIVLWIMKFLKKKSGA